MYSKTTLEAIHSIVKQEQDLDELKYFEFYPIQKRIFVKTPTGEALISHFVRKHGKKVEVTFAGGEKTIGIESHQFIGDQGERVKISDMSVGYNVRTATGLTSVLNIQEFDEDIDVFDITVVSDDHLFLTADGLQHHNTGKTQTIEDTLEEAGLSDGNGYFKITGSASPIGIYTALYKNRDGIVLFDDCDGAVESQDGRNIIKAATDTKKNRKIAWAKKSSGMYDPDSRAPKEEPAEGEEDVDIDGDSLPRHFQFTGRVIFISNLPLNKLDPDGALRTRAFIITIDPTPEEIFERMGEIVDSIKLESGHLSSKQRQEVLEVVKTSKNKSNASLRTLVRALGLAASGASNWKVLCNLYA